MKTKAEHVDLPLATLIHYLEREGFSIGIELRLKLQQVLISFWEGTQATDLQRMKHYIRPLVAKSEKEQELFDHAFTLYVNHIERESGAFEQRIITGQKKVSGHKVKPKKRRTKLPILLGLLDLIFILVFCYFLQTYRDAPRIDINIPAKNWALVGNYIEVNGKLTGTFSEGEILIDGKEVLRQYYSFAKDSTIRYLHHFDRAKTYDFTFRARNRFATRYASQSFSIAVCQDKPEIDFDYKIDQLNPRRVEFYPKLQADSNRAHSITFSSNDTIIGREQFESFSDSLIVYQFKDEASHSVALNFQYLASVQDSLCTSANVRKTIAVKDVILGDKLPLRKADLQQGELDSSRNIGTLLAFDVFSKDSWGKMSTTELLLLLGILIVLFVVFPLCIELFYFRKQKAQLSSRLQHGLEFEGLQAPYELEFPVHDHFIQPEKELYDLARMLKTRQESGRVRLDVDGSIRKTAEKAGFMDLQFKETTKVPEYLVVVDRSQSQGFHLELFDYMSSFLKSEDTFMEVFHFSSSFRKLKNAEHPHGISVEALSEKYPDHILLLISDGKSMVNPKWDRVYDWAAAVIPKWENKFLLTPRSYSEWDNNEDLLDQHIPVLPATVEGLRYLSEGLIEEELPDLKQRLTDLKPEQKPSFYNFSTVTAIEQYLADPLLFQWFCALAIYPQIHWSLVLVIGKELMERYGEQDAELSLNYHSLYKISEVSHLLDGDIDQELRLALLDKLDPIAERIARQAVLDLLNDMDVPEDSFMYREVLVQSTLNKSLIDKNDEAAAEDLFYLWQHNLIEDRVSKSYIEGPGNLWDEKAAKFFKPLNPKSWRHLLFPRGPAYLLTSLLLIFLLNISLLPLLFDSNSTPQEFSFNYSAQLNNKAVLLYEQGNEQQANDSLLIAYEKDNAVWQVPYNLDVLDLNNAIDLYKNKDFVGTTSFIRTRRQRTNADSIAYNRANDSLIFIKAHYIGLSEFYLDNIEGAEDIVNEIEYEDPNYFDPFPVSLKTLLEGREQGLASTPDPDPSEDETICDKFATYTRDKWRDKFIKTPTVENWQVVVASFTESSATGLTQANNIKNNFKSNYPDLDFEVLTTASPNTPNLPQYAIVMAQGIAKRPMALQLQTFARDCGIASDAFLIQGYVPYNDSEVEKTACLVQLRVQVRDSITLSSLSEAELLISNTQDVVLERQFVDRAGNSVYNLDCDQQYWVRASAKGYATKGEFIAIGRDLVLNLDLIQESESVNPELVDSSIIFFDFNKSSIRPDAEIELAKILPVMREFPEFKITIEAHTDARGSANAQQKLSDKRAESVRSWLIAQGIDRSRLTAVSFGLSQPVNRCSPGVECTEEEHQLNNRTEILIFDQ